jgi:formylmethanofuran dehydrogenase subunit C
MSGVLTLTPKETLTERVDLTPLTPDKLQGQSLKQIAAILINQGGRMVPAGSIFDIDGKAGDELIIAKSSDKLDNIGATMTAGDITVKGKAGNGVGFNMLNGTITVKGDAGGNAGSGMRNGKIEILGNAGDYLGGVSTGARQGMRGGTILVTGNAGDRMAERMRRGLIIVEGDTGSYTGVNMMAGTLVVLGKLGQFAGFGLKRGTIITQDKPQELLSTFNDCGEFEMNILNLMFRELPKLGRRYSFFKELPPYARRYAGDLGVDGKGELLVLQ